MNRPFSFSKPSTLCAQAGLGRGDGSPLTTPIVTSTTFCRDGVDSQSRHQYSRVSNPTVEALEIALGRLESALPAVCFGSGLAAEAALFLSFLQAGDHVVAARSLYGGTTRLIQDILGPLGVTATLVDSRDRDAVAKAMTPKTKLVFVETPSNPTLELTDIGAVASIAKRGGALLAVDNTFLTGVLQRPLDFGADLTVTSTTKFVEGHSAALGGAIVTRDEELRDRIGFIRKSTGGILAPTAAASTLQGLKTLPLRLERQSQSALRIAELLLETPGVLRVHYPSLGPGAQLAKEQHEGADGAVISFELAGGEQRARGVAQSVQLARLVEHVGSVETLLTHSSTMTHADVSRELKEEIGVSAGLLRLSVGLEAVEDIYSDLNHAIQSSGLECAASTQTGVSA